MEERLVFIRQDVDRLYNSLPIEVLDMPIKGYDDVRTLLNNISHASDINNDEPEHWCKIWYEVYCGDSNGDTHTIAQFDLESEAKGYVERYNACWYDAWKCVDGINFIIKKDETEQ